MNHYKTNDLQEAKSKKESVVLILGLAMLAVGLVCLSSTKPTRAHQNETFLALEGIEADASSLFVEKMTIIKSDPIRFGQAVAVDGNIAVVGAPKDNVVVDGSGNPLTRGSVRVYQKNPITKKWAVIQKISVSTGYDFGYQVSLDMSTKTLAVASYDDDIIFVYKMNWRSKFVLSQKITSGDDLPWTAYGSSFGCSVEVMGNYLVVGARHETVNALYYVGGVYIFERTNGLFSLKQRIFSSYGPGHFNVAVSMSRSRPGVLVVGAMASFGRTHVYKLENGKFVLKTILRSSVRVFGSSVALYGKMIAVGAYRPQLNGAGVHNPGAVFLYEEISTNVWKKVGMLSPGRRALGFGSSVDLTESELVVGAQYATNPTSGVGTGGVFVYKRSGYLLNLNQEIFSADANTALGFGKSVAVCRNTIVVGGYGLGNQGIAGFYEKK